MRTSFCRRGSCLKPGGVLCLDECEVSSPSLPLLLRSNLPADVSITVSIGHGPPPAPLDQVRLLLVDPADDRERALAPVCDPSKLVCPVPRHRSRRRRRCRHGRHAGFRLRARVDDGHPDRRPGLDELVETTCPSRSLLSPPLTDCRPHLNTNRSKGGDSIVDQAEDLAVALGPAQDRPGQPDRRGPGAPGRAAADHARGGQGQGRGTHVPIHVHLGPQAGLNNTDAVCQGVDAERGGPATVEGFANLLLI